MVAVTGTYKNGQVILDKEFHSKKPVKIIVTFIEEETENSERVLSYSDFSFAQSQELLKDLKGSLSEVIIEERRSSL